MGDIIRDLGAFAGLAAFVGLAVLALLYFAQARDVRRLRENAEFLVDPDAPGAPPVVPPPIGAEEASEEEPTQARAGAGAAPATGAEQFRRAELARQAAKRRERFEERRQGGDGRFEVPSTAIIVIGALILLAGIGFGASRLLSDDESSGGGGGGGNKPDLACRPADTRVAVLNGTAEPGLAADTVPRLEQRGYPVQPVTNTEAGFDTSVVMFGQGSQDCAPEIGELVGIPQTQQMDEDTLRISEAAPVAVVLGEDQVSGSSSSADTTDTTDSLGD